MAETNTDHSSPVMRRQRPSYKFTTAARFFCKVEEEETRWRRRHFFDECFLYKKPLGFYTDIHMYRGDIPFCNDDSRTEQIELDEIKEKSYYNYLSAKERLRQQEIVEARRITSPLIGTSAVSVPPR